MKLKIEILYYKLLGSIIVICPFEFFSRKLLEYANKRFPEADQGTASHE